MTASTSTPSAETSSLIASSGTGGPEAVYTMATMASAQRPTVTSSGRSVRSTSVGLPPFSF